MSYDRRQPDDLDGDPLDRLLQNAALPDVDSAQIERLARQWHRITRRRRWTQTGMTALFVLAAVSVTAGIFWSNGNRDRVPRAVPRVVQYSPSPPARPAANTDVVRQPAESVEPDPFEQLLCVAARRTSLAHQEDMRQRQAAVAQSEKESFDQVLRLAINQWQDGQDLGELMGEYREQLTEENLLQAIVDTNNQPSIATTLQLLSFVVTDRSLPVLLQLRDRTAFKELATEMVLQVANEQTLFRLAQREPDRPVRRRLCAALLRHGSDQSVHLFLQLVDDQRTSATAIAAVNDVETLPIDRLLSCLQARQRTVRLAAGFVLGRSNDDEVASRLMQLVQFNQSRGAALVGLLASETEIARQFVVHARHNVYLVAPLHAAQSVVRSFPTES